MFSKDIFFSSKPNQIASAILMICSQIFGDLKSISMLVISDSKLPFNIGRNLKKKKLNKYEEIDCKIYKYLDEKSKEIKKPESLLKLLRINDVVLLGFKSDLKLISHNMINRLLEVRKKKPILSEQHP